MQNTFGRDPSAKIDEGEIAEETCPTTPKQNAASQKVVPESFAEIESYIDLYLENNGGDLAKAIVEFGESGKRIRNFVESGKGQMTLRILQENPQIVPPNGKSNGSINYYAKFQEMFPSAKKFLISRSEFYKCARVKKTFRCDKRRAAVGQNQNAFVYENKKRGEQSNPRRKTNRKIMQNANSEDSKDNVFAETESCRSKANTFDESKKHFQRIYQSAEILQARY